MVPPGMVWPASSTSSCTRRSSTISGGCIRSVSLSAASRRGIERRAWKETSLPSAYRSSSSSVTDAITSGWRSSSIIVHAAVPELVWCPANIIEMKMPVM